MPLVNAEQALDIRITVGTSSSRFSGITRPTLTSRKCPERVNGGRLVEKTALNRAASAAGHESASVASTILSYLRSWETLFSWSPDTPGSGDQPPAAEQRRGRARHWHAGAAPPRTLRPARPLASSAARSLAIPASSSSPPSHPKGKISPSCRSTHLGGREGAVTRPALAPGVRLAGPTAAADL